MIRLFDITVALGGLAALAVTGCVAYAFLQTFGFSFIASGICGLCLFAAFKCLRVIVRG